MSISIIIVNYKSWKHLKNCLNSINKIEFKQLQIEVIIIDNFSNDVEIVKFKKDFPNFKFIENSNNNGFANGCNLGAKNASGDYLLFLNPDTIITEDPILKMYNYLEANSSVGIVSCKQKNEVSFEKINRYFPDFNTLFGLLRALNKNILLNKVRKEENVIFPDWVSGAVVFIGRNWFDKVNGWNEDYWMYFEDVDLSKKARNFGGEVALLTNAEIIHNHGGASRLNIKTATITKTEVLISKHVYIKNHFKGLRYFVLQYILVFITFLSKLCLGVFGVLFFFIPKLRLNVYLFFNIVTYYFKSLTARTWLSNKSMNHPNKK